MLMKTLFIGIGATPQTWYRAALPAKALGADWVGITEDFKIVTGQVEGESKTPVPVDYDVVVLQQPAGPAWLERIEALKSNGVRVLYEIDDYLHGISRVPEHVYRDYFTRNTLRWYDRCMDACEGLIVSTPFLAERYKKRPVWVCPNGIDPERYAYSRHEPREYTTVGWAGATGHVDSLTAWLRGGAGDAIRESGSRLVILGPVEAAEAAAEILPVRFVPWSAFDTYPAAMATCDVMIAPAGNTLWHRAKSDLRWLEASALGLPTVCDHHRYPEAEYRATSPEDAGRTLAGLLADPVELAAAGDRAREQVLSTRAFPTASEPWSVALRS